MNIEMKQSLGRFPGEQFNWNAEGERERERERDEIRSAGTMGMTFPASCEQDAGSYGRLYGFGVIMRSRRSIICSRHRRVPNIEVKFGKSSLMIFDTTS